MEGFIFAGLILAVLVYTSVQSAITQKKKIRDRIKKEYNEPLDRELNYDTYEALKSFFYKTTTRSENSINDDTWNDLNMDELYMEINNTYSSVGREYLYAFLRKPCNSQEELDRRNNIANGFAQNEEKRTKVQEAFANLGVARKCDIFSYLMLIEDYPAGKNICHYVCIFLLAFCAFAICSFRADVSIIITILSVAYIVISYFKEKARIEQYLDCVKWIACMISTSRKICAINPDFLKDELEQLSQCASGVRKIRRNMFLLVTGNNMGGSLEDVIMDYVRILTHVDLIKFNNSIMLIKKNFDTIIRMYETLGYIESCIAIAAYRNKLKVWSVPKLSPGNTYKAENLYHPLLKEPVSNSITADKCVLLTGSNASGKSTFLRSVAINALLSQTMYTSTTTSYEGDFYRIVSSMSHKDSIMDGDSYYMVEIKALKYILEQAEYSDEKLLCFLDEVLRGTNTVERIAASTQILKSFDGTGALCFAATHDIELTTLLSSYYDNYHFEESFENNDVKYSYRLEKGPAVSRNAIRLLGQMGYDPKLIDNANALTKKFEETGAWC